jgi:hypothetical protein
MRLLGGRRRGGVLGMLSEERFIASVVYLICRSDV